MNKSLTRRILAAWWSFVAASVLAYLALHGVTEALVAIITIASMVVGFYFKSLKE